MDVAKPPRVCGRVAPLGPAVPAALLAGEKRHPERAARAREAGDVGEGNPVDPQRVDGRGPPAGLGEQPVQQRARDLPAAQTGKPGLRNPAHAPADPCQASRDRRRRVRVVAEADGADDRVLVAGRGGDGLPRRPERVGDVSPAGPPRPGEELAERPRRAACRPWPGRARRGRRRGPPRGSSGCSRRRRGQEDVERTGHPCQRLAVRHGRRRACPGDERGVVAAASGERHGEDPHQRAVPERVRLHAPGSIGRHPGLERAHRGERRAADVEGPVAVRGIGAALVPRPDPAPLVLGVEAHGRAAAVGTSDDAASPAGRASARRRRSTCPGAGRACRGRRSGPRRWPPGERNS